MDEGVHVRVGGGETMTQGDLHEGRLIAEVGMAALRPAEFVVFRFHLDVQPADPAGLR